MLNFLKNLNFKKRLSPIIQTYNRSLLNVLVAAIFIGLAIIFIKNQHAELIHVEETLRASKWEWLIIGAISVIIYILLQGYTYVFSFSTIQLKISLYDAVLLFIKRNFISVFLPAGGVSSLAFFTGAIEKKGIKKSQIYFASSIYEFIGILTVIIVAIPAFLYKVFVGRMDYNEWLGLIGIILILFFLYIIYYSFKEKKLFYSLFIKWFPQLEVVLNDLQKSKIEKKPFYLVIIASILIEFVGIFTILIAMQALSLPISFSAAVMAYIISVMSLMISPFLRGLGPVEISMAYILIRFGYNNVDAVSITLLYRFFEFWLPLVIGILSFFRRINAILMRVVPALFIFLLGIINIVSVLTPAIPSRLHYLQQFIPLRWIQDSNYLVLFSGIIMLIIAGFLIKGLRSAWWAALGLSVISLIGNITKAIDYEEALFTLTVIALLLSTRKEYFIKSNVRLRKTGVKTALSITLAVIFYGIAGFYFLSKKHFNIDFSLAQSIHFTLRNYFLIGSNDLIPADSFARYFLYSINFSGFLSFAFLIYTFVRTFLPDYSRSEEDLILARNLVLQYGNSPLDYFKTYQDKMFFFSESKKAFISFKISGHYAAVLENPVAENSEEMEKCIKEFDTFCLKNGIGNFYYRVPEQSLNFYIKVRKRTLFIGYQGVVDLSTFNIHGNRKQSIRNAINKLKKSGYKAVIHHPPQSELFLQALESVSNNWISDNGKPEIVFSQGMFISEEIKQQTVITVESSEGRVIAFANIIPDYAKEEGTYDLMRKTNDAPNGTMDFLMIHLFEYFKSIQIRYVNLGFVAFGEVTTPHNFSEKLMKFAYSKIKLLNQHGNLRNFKEKFDPVWEKQYLIYNHDYDLLNIPSSLAKAFKVN